MKHRPKDVQSLRLELPHEQGAVRVGCQRAEHWRLLLGIDVILGAFVHPVIQNHWVPRRTAVQQTALSACKRLHHIHYTTNAWLAVAFTDAAAVLHGVRHICTESLLACITACIAFLVLLLVWRVQKRTDQLSEPIHLSEHSVTPAQGCVPWVMCPLGCSTLGVGV